MQLEELRDTLAVLREFGVTSAEFDEDGQIAKVTLGPLAPVVVASEAKSELEGPKIPMPPEEDPESIRSVLQLPDEMKGDPSWTPDDEVLS